MTAKKKSTRKASKRAYKPNAHNEFEAAVSRARVALGSVVVSANAGKFDVAKDALKEAHGELDHVAEALPALAKRAAEKEKEQENKPVRKIKAKREAA